MVSGQNTAETVESVRFQFMVNVRPLCSLSIELNFCRFTRSSSRDLFHSLFKILELLSRKAYQEKTDEKLTIEKGISSVRIIYFFGTDFSSGHPLPSSLKTSLLQRHLMSIRLRCQLRVRGNNKVKVGLILCLLCRRHQTSGVRLAFMKGLRCKEKTKRSARESHHQHFYLVLILHLHLLLFYR